ncbi:unnamed protein product [Nesidiocoris tenuis]|uniref:ubiquitinyl hydrolase 1 n=1 Tax=Nesidiocoris tenuis TaxID=355587 RepID=A0A6H5HA72_9HEMI|nr:unnamed protein product [Nesidiocoris tenuis]
MIVNETFEPVSSGKKNLRFSQTKCFCCFKTTQNELCCSNTKVFMFWERRSLTFATIYVNNKESFKPKVLLDNFNLSGVCRFVCEILDPGNTNLFRRQRCVLRISSDIHPPPSIINGTLENMGFSSLHDLLSKSFLPFQNVSCTLLQGGDSCVVGSEESYDSHLRDSPYKVCDMYHKKFHLLRSIRVSRSRKLNFLRCCYWNRPEIENRNGASEDISLYTFTQNRFLNKCLWSFTTSVFVLAHAHCYNVAPSGSHVAIGSKQTPRRGKCLYFRSSSKNLNKLGIFPYKETRTQIQAEVFLEPVNRRDRLKTDNGWNEKKPLISSGNVTSAPQIEDFMHLLHLNFCFDLIMSSSSIMSLSFSLNFSSSSIMSFSLTSSFIMTMNFKFLRAAGRCRSCRNVGQSRPPKRQLRPRRFPSPISKFAHLPEMSKAEQHFRSIPVRIGAGAPRPAEACLRHRGLHIPATPSETDPIYCIELPTLKEATQDTGEYILLVWVNTLIVDDQCARSTIKLTTLVDFPAVGFDMTPHLCGTGNPSPWWKQNGNGTGHQFHNTYDLYAVCNHHGQNLHTGHYTAYCRNPYNGQWYCFDDTTVSGVNESDLVTPAAYILFYQRRGLLSPSSSSSASSTSEHWATKLLPPLPPPRW